MTLSPIDDFIESWGSLGALWGINRSMARIQALILVTEEPLRLDQIAERLEISRGNVSMSLRELRSWGVIKRVNLPGDRRDYFTAEADTWAVLVRIASERKRREFDPALGALQRALSDPDSVKGESARGRLTEMETILATVDRMATSVLSDPNNAKTLLHFFAGLIAQRVNEG